MASMASPAASIIVLVLDRIDALQECLASLFEHSADSPDFEVIVVANGTPAEQLAQIGERPGLRIIPVPANLGFA